MKKLFIMLLAAALLLSCFSGCGGVSEDSGKLKIVATVFPEYDWVMNILGDCKDSAEVTMLLDSGVDLHSFQPTADDIIRVSTCDLFIYVGGESDTWAEDALKTAANKDMVVINLLEVLGDSAKTEETVEGMEAEEGEEEAEYDEHVWLSLKNAEVFVSAIKDALVKLDADNADTYSANAESYIEKLGALDAEFTAAVSSAKVKTLLFGDRFPFRYLTDDYGLDYFAAFSGCSAESEASFETVAFLAGKVDELGLSSVLTLEGTDHSLAETIVASTAQKNAQLLAMDSMQSVTFSDIEDGASYLGIMEKNLGVLKAALG